MKKIFNKISKTKFYALAISSLVVVGAGSTYWYCYGRYPLITSYVQTRDSEFVRTLFGKDWYWLVSARATDFSLEHMLATHSSSVDPEDYQNLEMFILYQDRTTPAGFMAFYKKKFYVGQFLFLVVKEELRNKKYGARLLEFAMSELKKRGVSRIDIATRVTDLPARKLYERHGFKETDTTDGFVHYSLFV